MARRVLYIEDNPHNILLIKRIIQVEGYELFEAIDAESGWDQVVRQRPDFIFMDLLLPGIDGIELTHKIKTTPHLCHIPIVVLTSHGNKQIEAKAKAAGCDGFLYKPSDMRQIQAILHQFLGVPSAPGLIH